MSAWTTMTIKGMRTHHASDSGISSGAHGYSDRDSGSDVTTTAYKGRGALPTETVVPKPQSSAKDH